MSTMMKAMRFVGDLDDEFYDDERQRDVWNEASAVGLQSILWTGFVTAAVLPWAAGRTGAWIALTLLIVVLLGSVVTIIYAQQRDVDVYALSHVNRPRAVISVALYLVAAVGVLARLRFDSYQDSSTWVGALIGGIVGGGIAVALVMLRQQRARRREQDEELL